MGGIGVELSVFHCNTATYVALLNAACEISASLSLGLGFDFYSLRRKRLRSLLLLLFFYCCRKRLILEAFGRIVGFFLLRQKSCFCPSNFLQRESSESWCWPCSFSPRKVSSEVVVVVLLVEEIDLEVSTRSVVFFSSS